MRSIVPTSSSPLHLHLHLHHLHLPSIFISPSKPTTITMTSIFHHPKSLPVSLNPTPNSPAPAAGIRRRISAMSFHIQPPTIKSVSSMGESASISVRNWWDRGWEWILSKKPVFAQDLEMNQEETIVLGCHNKGSWRHILYKFRSEIRKLIGADQAGLPQTIRSGSYKSAIY